MKTNTAGLILATIFIAGCGRESSPVAPDVQPTAGSAVSVSDPSRMTDLPDNFPVKKILCFGDSITFGVTQLAGNATGAERALTTVEGYIPKLWRRLEARYGTGFDLVNVGIGGENTREGRERIDAEIRRHDPDLVLILEGIVDVNNEVPRFPVVRSNLAEMMRIVRIRGRLAIIGTYLPVNPDGFRIFAIENIVRLNNVIRQEAKAKNVPIADHEVAAAGDFRDVGADGLHPNDIGYELMAQVWFETIEAMLEQMGVS